MKIITTFDDKRSVNTLNIKEAFAFMLDFDRSLVSRRLGMSRDAVYHLGWRFERNMLEEHQMIRYLRMFGFSLDVKCVLQKAKNHAKEV